MDETRPRRWRQVLRALHRDVGYFSIGFTLLYAVSGLAINHVADWDPNFVSARREVTIAPIAATVSEADAVAHIRNATGLGQPTDVFRAGDEIHLTFAGGTAVVLGDTGAVTIDAQTPRPVLRIINWLHVNRGKAAWTYIADAYAVLLIYLALSGLFMLRGRYGLRWRGTVLALTGIAVPTLYVVLSGGPSGHAKNDPAPSATVDQP